MSLRRGLKEIPDTFSRNRFSAWVHVLSALHPGK
jgi:hypothetical protein